MTGGGHHRGRAEGPGGAHWWGGTGPTGGGTHAARRSGRRGLLLVAVGLLAAVGVVVALAVAQRPDPAPAALSGAAPRSAGGAATGEPAGAHTVPTAPAADAAVLRSTIDEVLAGAPLRFPPDAATPNPDTSATVDRLAAVLRATPGPPVVVEGHTAPAGEDTGGALQLSQQRADEIARRLEAAGVPAGRLTVVGVGSAGPLASLEASRRVEIRVD